MYILGLNSNYIARELVSNVVSVKLHLRDGRTDGQTVRLLDGVWHLAIVTDMKDV